MMTGKIQTRYAVLGALTVLVALVVGALAAQADPEKPFTLEVEPAIVVGGPETIYDIKITNIDNNELGAVRVQSPFEFEEDDVAPLGESEVEVFNSDGDPTDKTWTITSVDPDNERFEITADSQKDRMEFGEFFEVVLTVDAPTDTDFDTLGIFDAVGRQSNTFNDQQGGNDFFLEPLERTSPAQFTGRLDEDGDGVFELTTLDPVFTHEVLVLNGASADCSIGDTGCSVSAGESGEIQVTVTAETCDNGTIVADGVEETTTSGGISGGFYSYLDGNCDDDLSELPVVTLEILYPKSLDKKPGQLEMFLDYGGKTGFPDGTTALPDCKDDDDGVDCVESIKNGPDGILVVIRAQLTDPIGFS